MAAAFADQLSITPDNARCVARETIEAVGLQHLVEIGMFDEAMTFHDRRPGPVPRGEERADRRFAHLRDGLTLTAPSCTNLSLLPNGSRMPASMP